MSRLVWRWRRPSRGWPRSSAAVLLPRAVARGVRKGCRMTVVRVPVAVVLADVFRLPRRAGRLPAIGAVGLSRKGFRLLKRSLSASDNI